MKIFKIKLVDEVFETHDFWDTYTGFVVKARDIGEAQKLVIHYNDLFKDLSIVRIEEVDMNGPPEVIFAEFMRG